MSNFLKQSTSVVISFGPFLDKTDGVTEETGLVSALDHASTGIKLSKNGGALTIRHATVTTTTYDAYGMYRVTLDTTDTNSLGTLRVAFNEAATCLPVWQDFMVLPANIYDSLVGGSDLLDVSVTQILGTAVSTPATAGVLDVNVKNAGNTAWASGAIVAGAIASGAITNAKFAAGAIDAAAIADNAIDAGSIATGAITNAKFAAGAIDAAAIADNAIDNATFAADVGSTAYATNKIALAADKAIANAALATAANLAAAKSVVDNIETKLGLPDITIADDIAGVKAETALIKAKTDNLPAAPAAVGDIPTAAENATATWSDDPEAYSAGQAGNTLFTLGEQTPIDAAGVRAAVGLATNNLDAQLASIPAAASAATWGDTRADYTVVGTFGEVMNGAGGQLAADVAAVKADTEAIKAKTDNLPAEPASRTNITSAAGVAVTSIANNVVTAAVLDASAVAEFAARLLDGENLDTGLTVRHGLELAAGGILNKLTGAGTGIEKVRNFSDTDDLASVTLDINGNKTAVAYNFSI